MRVLFLLCEEKGSLCVQGRNIQNLCEEKGSLLCEREKYSKVNLCSFTFILIQRVERRKKDKETKA